MIADLDASLANWLGRFVPDAAISFTPPAEAEVPDLAGRPTLVVFLSDVREDVAASTPGWTSLRDESGVVVGRRAPSRSYRLAYLLVAFAATTLEEHDVLGRALAGSLAEEVVPAELLVGQLRTAEEPVVVRAAPATPSISTQGLWSAWGTRPRASLELVVHAPMPDALVHEVAQPPSRIDLGAGPLARSPGSVADPTALPRRPASRIAEG